jgi:hypothetical protein
MHVDSGREELGYRDLYVQDEVGFYKCTNMQHLKWTC